MINSKKIKNDKFLIRSKYVSFAKNYERVSPMYY